MNIANLTEFKTYSVTIKAIDFIGNISKPSEVLQVTITPPVSINQLRASDAIFEVNINPNPITDDTVLSILAEREDNYFVSVFDLLGRTVYQKQFFNAKNERLELQASQNQSIYILKVTNSKNQTVMAKIYK